MDGLSSFNAFDENVLVARLCEGDRSAFHKIYVHYYELLFGYVYSLCKDKQTAEDVVQETLVKLWERRSNIKSVESLKPFLYTSAKNRFLDQYRKSKVRSEMIERLRVEAFLEFQPIDEQAYQEKVALLYEQIERLPKMGKKVFLLSKFEKYKYKEIAELLNISDRTVETHIRKAMLFLKKTMLFIVCLFLFG